MEALKAHYGNGGFVEVVDRDTLPDRIDPRSLNGTNRHASDGRWRPETGATVLIAILDNLGKGASGAAVQNLNIMLGMDEATGL
jgi:N-acetyl-gamma-glutamyl-phosphate reductase